VVVDGTMLAEIYSWFTEGFDTADLKDASYPGILGKLRTPSTKIAQAGALDV
jgi:hypothetical protein